MFHRTQRLLLRPVWPEDAPAIHRGIADEEIVANLAQAPWPYTLADAEAYVSLPVDPMHPGFAITLPNPKGGSAYIGQVGFNQDKRGRFQVGYWIAREHWGKGFATEATRGALEVVRSLGRRHVWACHFADNPASGRVLRKAGFKPTGEDFPVFSRARKTKVASVHLAIDLAGEDEPSVTMPRAA